MVQNEDGLSKLVQKHTRFAEDINARAELSSQHWNAKGFSAVSFGIVSKNASSTLFQSANRSMQVPKAAGLGEKRADALGWLGSDSKDLGARYLALT